MTSLFRLLLLPIQAPMLLLLMAVSTYLGLHWGLPLERSGAHLTPVASLIWSAECAQALVVVMICCMPDLLLRRFSTLLAASRVVTLVAILLLVTIAGLYLLHLDVLSNVLILASAVLLARLDLVRLRLMPQPALLAILLSLVVLGGASLGHWLSSSHDHGPSPLFRRPTRATLLRKSGTSSIDRAPLFGRVGGTRGRTTPP
jgi:hypothetical protein